MSSDHVERKHLVERCIRTTERRRELIARLSLDEIDIRILTLRHVERKSFIAISREIIMSPAQIGKRYKIALEALTEVAEKEQA